VRRGRRLRVTSRLAAVLAGALAAALALWSLLVPAGQDDPRLLSVAPGQSVSAVAAMLGDKGLIRSPDLFTLAAYVSGKWRRIQAGRYEFTARMSALEILDALCHGTRKAWRWITIPEGYTLRQIADELDKAGLVQASTFLQEAQLGAGGEASFPAPSGGLEGYLFPDTYRIDAGAPASAIIAQMLRRFDQVVWAGLCRGKPTYRGRSLQEIIILASLVEGEAKKGGERSLIAGVLANRLKRGIRLECDATVQYALGDGRKARLTHQDLQTESEYNTYLHPGLPPGPICSPGEASIKAVMDPAAVPYLYYVAKPDGSHVFSTTYAEHQAAVARIRGSARERSSRDRPAVLQAGAGQVGAPAGGGPA